MVKKKAKVSEYGTQLRENKNKNPSLRSRRKQRENI